MSDDVAEVSSPVVGERHVRPLFVVTIVTGSFLLFLTQPMIARMALPRLGGAPAVWNSAMLVFQALLLAGYAYAHWLTRLKPRLQAGVHIALFALAALWLPIGLAAMIPPAAGNPALWTPWFLLLSIGPLFFIVSAQAPLMQRWYALETSRGEPYALYAASNLGSFAGLISYPLIVEPLLGLKQQSLLWTAGYALLVLLVAICALTIPRSAVEEKIAVITPKPEARRIAHWIALAAVPSGLMLSTTTHLTTDIVAMPLLWVIPLALYLLSFVVAFANRRRAAAFITQMAPLILLIAGGLAFANGSHTPLFSGTLGLSLLFVLAVALHAEMYRLRPAVDHLTGFYLAMSVGGVIGGLFCAILAPALFDWAYEHPLLILAGALLLPQQPLFGALQRLWAHPFWSKALTILLPLAALLVSLIADRRLWFYVPDGVSVGGSILISAMAVFCIGRRLPYTLCLAALMMSYGGWTTLNLSTQDFRVRSYFGIYEIGTSNFGTTRMLTHGTTLHGIQQLIPGRGARADHLLRPAVGGRQGDAGGGADVRAACWHRRDRPRHRHARLLRQTGAKLALLRDRSGDGADRHHPIQLPVALRPAGADRDRRRAADPGLAARRFAGPAGGGRLLVGCGADAPADSRGDARLRSGAAAGGAAAGAHLQSLSQPAAGARRQRREGGLGDGAARTCSRCDRGGS